MHKLSATNGMAKTSLNRLLAIASDQGLSADKDSVDSRLLQIKGERIDTGLYLSVVEEIVNLLNIPDLGMRSGQNFNMGDLGVLGHAIISSEDLAAAVKTYVDYRQAFGSVFNVHHFYDGRELKITADLNVTHGALQRFLIENWLTTLTALSDLVKDGESLFSAIEVPYPEPQHSEEFHRQFNCPIAYGREHTRVVFNGEIGRDSLKYSCKVVNDFCKSECMRALQNLGASQSLVHTVRTLLMNSGEGFLCPADIGRRLNMSERSLRRHLALSGSSYNKLLLEVRMDLACQYLSTGNRSIKDIAYSLGYGDVVSYHRAFKSYYGITPKQFSELDPVSRVDITKRAGL
ncbi:AraC family transcriptional regulator ligand-binding domain-containing protein [Microbulbifer sp. TYP-18]|uniref:helix-turn-helix transcriptional regulator n=1 Tax=Microbulbifer sp. TYP-18 TaxID=3230024 RepID=UPI0034C635A5